MAYKIDNLNKVNKPRIANVCIRDGNAWIRIYERVSLVLH